ncbi:hypothetical protein B0T10DRAFT_273048 [Thelonectria olida]|uniref:Uncharacterized protein n=1 Tax=Thelonectria olida TaxID=1576542 RepID=A0A9P9APK6_9HYPO|nr:hypothetical protein B0T10DRAFT_273048 [Thelonectria olida]
MAPYSAATTRLLMRGDGVWNTLSAESSLSLFNGVGVGVGLWWWTRTRTCSPCGWRSPLQGSVTSNDSADATANPSPLIHLSFILFYFILFLGPPSSRSFYTIIPLIPCPLLD